jgi:Cu(I)/Ag(I) efflux system membrane protein CusA/SilA
MIDKIIDFSIKNAFLVLLSTFIMLGASFWAISKTSLDALPDISPPQVIIQVKWSGQSPKIIENQVSYPLISNLMSLHDIETVRAMSSFENALIYVIFKDGVDLYESRNRILEQLSTLTPTFPKGVEVNMGPDATGVGWAYEYALVSKTKNLQELRTLQDYYYKYALLGVDGVSEVASVGGFVKNYEVKIDADRVVEFGIDVDEVINKIRQSNNDKGGKVVLESGFEKIIQASGYLQGTKDLENLTIKEVDGLPVKISDIAEVVEVPLNRRGMADLNGQGEVVGGIVVIRFGENPYRVIKDIKEKLKTLKIDDVEVVETYDRTSLIDKAIDTLKHTLTEESIIVMFISALFLFHLRSSLIVIIILPITVAFTFLLMKIFGIGSNIMSLGGIAIAIGAMVDAAIVMIENAHKHIHKHIKTYGVISAKERLDVIVASSKQVAKPIFFALMLVVVSFLPIFALSGQEGRLFSPLAFTKSFAMIGGAVLSITLVPILMIFFIKGHIVPEEKNFLNRFFQILYLPVLKLSLKVRYLVIVLSLGILFLLYPLYQKQNWEFMPMMNEQSFMYMPVTPYGIGIDFAKELTQKTDEIIKSFPEVETVFGKAGRADTATDPAPLAMIETIITFKPESEWREGVTYESLMRDMEKTLQIPGLINSWTYPIRGRIDMLLTGIRTPLGIKLYGNDHKLLQVYATKIEQKLKKFDKTMSVSSDKTNSGYYLNIEIDQDALNRYGLSKNKILDLVQYAIGGAKISTMIEGLERYPISIRYQDDQRDDLHDIENLQIKTNFGFQPLSRFAKLSYTEDASVIKSEKGLKVNFVYITPKNGISSKSYKDEADKIVKSIKLPNGYYYEWAGQSQYLESAMKRLVYIIPATFVIIFILIYFALKNFVYASIVFLTLPFALIGGLWYIDFLNFNISIAVIVGFLALLGIAAETAIVMMVYLDEAVEEKEKKLGELDKKALKDAVVEGAAMRLRPKLMTVFAILGGLLPIVYLNGVGSEVMQRIAVPMIGGMVSSTVLTLIIIPVLFYMSKLRNI